MKAAVCLGMALALVGCVTAQEQHQQLAVAQCHGEKTSVGWMRCLNEPETRIVGETLLMAYKHAAQRQAQ